MGAHFPAALQHRDIALASKCNCIQANCKSCNRFEELFKSMTQVQLDIAREVMARRGDALRVLASADRIVDEGRAILGAPAKNNAVKGLGFRGNNPCENPFYSMPAPPFLSWLRS